VGEIKNFCVPDKVEVGITGELRDFVVNHGEMPRQAGAAPLPKTVHAQGAASNPAGNGTICAGSVFIRRMSA
jgi:hypothetical protein